MLKFLFILLQFRNFAKYFKLFLTLIGIILFYQSDKRVVYTRISWLGRKSYSRSCKDRSLVYRSQLITFNIGKRNLLTERELTNRPNRLRDILWIL